MKLFYTTSTPAMRISIIIVCKESYPAKRKNSKMPCNQNIDPKDLNSTPNRIFYNKSIQPNKYDLF